MSGKPDRLPPRDRTPKPLMGLRIVDYTVGDWCPTPDGTGPPEAVAIAMQVAWNQAETMHLVMRLRTPRAVDNLIQALLRHKRSVWPDAP